MRSALVLVAFVGLVSPAYGQVAGGSFGYARLGYGAVLGQGDRGAGPAFGFGIRGELDIVAVDFSFLNFVVPAREMQDGGAFASSLIRLQVLRFLDPAADRSIYLGGGMSYAGITAGRSLVTDTTYTTNWDGSGMQGELTAGYEIARSSPIRLFVQADVGLPLFMGRSSRYPRHNGITDFNSPTLEKRYLASAAVTFGLGWQRGRP